MHEGAHEKRMSGWREKDDALFLCNSVAEWLIKHKSGRIGRKDREGIRKRGGNGR